MPAQSEEKRVDAILENDHGWITSQPGVIGCGKGQVDGRWAVRVYHRPGQLTEQTKGAVGAHVGDVPIVFVPQNPVEMY
ncbi:MAG: hypothetical protein IT428_30250 [Planctomycetaceae bacterium]|nr:hypothetical protein [Planctomycetaceae bacterium]